MRTRILTTTAIAIAATLLLTTLPNDAWTASGASGAWNPAKVGWSDTLDDNPGAIAAFGTKIYTFGCGIHSPHLYPAQCNAQDPRINQVVILDLTTNITTIQPLDYSIFGGVAAATGNVITILGGEQGHWPTEPHIHVSTYDPATNTLTPANWEVASNYGLEARAAYDASTGNIVLLTGLGPHGSSQIQIEVYPPQGSVLDPTQTTILCGSYDFRHHAAIAAANTYVVVGGCQQKSPTGCLFIWQPYAGFNYNPECVTLPKNARSVGVAIKDGKAIQLGGWAYDSDTSTEGPIDEIFSVDLVSLQTTVGHMSAPRTFYWSIGATTGTYLYRGHCEPHADCVYCPAEGCYDIFRYV